ncbi:MAG TPA: hypothetical protein VGK23_09540 [Methanomassiliicoccales archaeon]
MAIKDKIIELIHELEGNLDDLSEVKKNRSVNESILKDIRIIIEKIESEISQLDSSSLSQGAKKELFDDLKNLEEILHDHTPTLDMKKGLDNETDALRNEIIKLKGYLQRIS